MKDLNSLLFQKGTLKNRINNIDWPELVFLAEAEREPYANIQIITLYSHCEDLAYQQCPAMEFNLDHLSEIEAQEFLRIYPDRVVVAVDAEKIDDIAVDRALDMLATIDEFTVGTYETFGQPKSFEYRECVAQPEQIL